MADETSVSWRSFEYRGGCEKEAEGRMGDMKKNYALHEFR